MKMVSEAATREGQNHHSVSFLGSGSFRSLAKYSVLKETEEALIRDVQTIF